ncbi:MAG TPA: DUF4214 domain-containing protein [Pirellulales bacterium]|nr:DUF4214 domain-containing protein [Pirellulales bacterium]
MLLTAAATITWTGGSTSSSNWSDPANWDLNRAPIDGDSLVFPGTAQRLANNDDIGGLSVNSIAFQGAFSTTTGGYTLSGDDLTVGAGGIVDNGSESGVTGSMANQIDLNVALAAAQSWSIDDSNNSHHVTVNGNVANNGFALTASGAGTIDIAGEISGSGSLSAGGPGNSLTLDLDHANTYSGGTYVNYATVAVSADGALGPGGTNDAGTTVDPHGAILFNALAYSTAESITLNGGNLEGGGDSSFSGPITITGVQSGTLGAGFDGEILNGEGTFTLNGPTLTNNGDANLLIRGSGAVPFASDAVAQPISGHGVVINAVIGGSGGVSLFDVDLVLGAVNTYLGATDLGGVAKLEVGVDNAIPSASAVVMQSSILQANAIFLEGHSDTIGSLAGSEEGGANTVELGTGGSLTTDGNNTSTPFDGNITGSGTLTKVGRGTLDLTATTNFTGTTYVDGGTLLVDGSTAAGNDVVVGRATLGGSGKIGGTIRVTGGTISPGAGPDPSSDTGTLTSAGAVTLAGFYPPTGSPLPSREAAFAVQLGDTAAPANDQLSSAAGVSLFGAVLRPTTLAGTGPFSPGQQFVIVQAGAPITTTFDGLPEGSTVSDGAQNFTISYANDRVTLTAQPLSATTSTYLNGQAGDGTAATFIQNPYRELLGREPDAAGQAYWVSLYDQLLGTGSRVPGSPSTQQAFVADFLNSPEYRQHLVEGIYTDFLHRAADADGLAFWTAELAAGIGEKNVLAHIVASEEYFLEAPPGKPISATPTFEAESWVDALYRDVLGRTADSGGLAYWTQQTLSMDNPVGRTGIALEFLTTPEVEHKLLNGNYPGSAGSVGAPGTPADGAYALADITGNGWDNLYFQGNLSTAVVDSLFAQLQAGESYDQTIAGMLDMSQYFGLTVIPFDRTN